MQPQLESSHLEALNNWEWNPAHFDRVVEDYQARIYRFIYSLVGEAELAQDLTQDTFLLAYRSLCHKQQEWSAAASEGTGSGEPEGWQPEPAQNNLNAWLYTIARNASYTELRRRKIIRFLPFSVRCSHDFDGEFDKTDYLPQLEPGGGVEANIALRDELEQVMDRLGREKFTALLLHIDGFSYREISAITGDKLSNVKIKIHRAKESLRQALLILQF